ncbi:glycosyl hydrolase family 28 protein [Sphingobacterium sp. HJSM2_6]|uniref:glycosyl hydrolase family 28 protein n=1 Tax=Sphingobacterium sp. HJSM2_6 TaxID=3366264 RepID=UPI003BDCF8F9
MNKITFILLFFTLTFSKAFAVEYNASAFGCVSDGQTNNTKSIQAAIDFISSKGGGTLNFYVGRYLTGGLTLKSNVTIQLHEGAILLANPSFYDFIKHEGKHYFIFAQDQTNLKIIGKGVILGQAKATLQQIQKLQQNGILDAAVAKPILVGLLNCKDVTIDGIHLEDAASDIYAIQQSSNIVLSNQIIHSTSTATSNAVNLTAVHGILLEKLYVDVTGKALIKDGLSNDISIKASVNKDGKSIK